MARPTIALLTDFGTRDHYVGAMKGVILGICPEATLVDITHDIPPHDIVAGALELSAACKYFPERTIFIAVVDPGVGSTRRGIAADAGGYQFVGPDNGVLGLVLRQRPCRVVELTEPRYARPAVGRTFEGRDRFAPAAAWLATGVDVGALGLAVTSWRSLDLPVARIADQAIVGEVVRVDRFGNLVTNIERALLDQFAAQSIVVTAGTHSVDGIVTVYAEAPEGAVCALFGSTDHLEIAVNGASAADRLVLGRGARVTVSRASSRER